MIVKNDQLPEGTDAIVAGAAVTSDKQEQMIVEEPTRRDRVVEKVKTSSSKLATTTLSAKSRA